MDIDNQQQHSTSLSDLPDLLAAMAIEADRCGFSGAIRVDAGGQLLYESAHGMADRAHGVPNSSDTLFGAASGTKGYTALVVMALVERGQLSLSTTARS